MCVHYDLHSGGRFYRSFVIDFFFALNRADERVSTFDSSLVTEAGIDLRRRVSEDGDGDGGDDDDDDGGSVSSGDEDEGDRVIVLLEVVGVVM